MYQNLPFFVKFKKDINGFLAWTVVTILFIVGSVIGIRGSIASPFEILEQQISIILIPLIATCLVYLVSKVYSGSVLVYGLFFSISLTSYLGFTETLTGSHATSTSLLFYGMAFYTAYLAYQIKRQNLELQHIFIGTNPALLITGPISVFFSPIKHKKLQSRLAYYLPFMVIGLFMFKVVATPLTEFFGMIELTDMVSATVFAIIFELFVYANFMGLSLMIYALFGLLGYKIPLNFKQPFSSRNLIDFWKGWHVSLSMVLKGIFYDPVKSKFQSFAFSTQLAIMVVFLASAFWHGITFNFLVWGLFHGALFVVTLALLKKRLYVLTPLILLIGIVVGRMIFADSDTDRLIEKLSFAYSYEIEWKVYLLGAPKTALVALLIAVVLVFIEFVFLRNRHVAKRNYKYLRVPFSQMILIGLFVLLASSAVGVDYAVYGQR
jgi:alginate O-acetyltransferase complex protein AlgI